MRGWGSCAAAAVVLAASALSEAAPVQPTSCQGSPNAGKLAGGVELRARPYLRIKPGSERRAWGHPLLLRMLDAGARAAGASPAARVLVGDLSARRGGRLSGHASHQRGLDADVGFLVADSRGYPAELDDFVRFDGSGHSRGRSRRRLSFDSRRNWLMLRSWLSDLRAQGLVIFVSAPIRGLLLEYAAASPEFRPWLKLARRTLRAHAAHADHFHLRIGCPGDQGPGCRR